MNRQLGRPETIFSAFFIWGAFKQFGADTNEFNALLIFWVVFIVLNIPSLAKTIEELFKITSEGNEGNALGQIFSVQSKNTFLVKLFPFSERDNVQASIFDFVELKYSTDNKIRKGLILDTYLLDQEQWIKVLSNKEIERIFGGKTLRKNHTADVVQIK